MQVSNKLSLGGAVAMIAPKYGSCTKIPAVCTEAMQQCHEAHHDASRAMFWLQPLLTMLDQPPYLFTGNHNFSQSSVNCCLTRVS